MKISTEFKGAEPQGLAFAHFHNSNVGGGGRNVWAKNGLHHKLSHAQIFSVGLIKTKLIKKRVGQLSTLPFSWPAGEVLAIRRADAGGCRKHSFAETGFQAVTFRL
jgi:hypothetical protein